MRTLPGLALILTLCAGLTPALAQRDPTLTPITPETRNQVYTLAALTAPTAAVTTLAFSPDGAWLAAGDAGGAIWLWPIRQGTVAGAEGRFLKAHDDGVTALAISPDGRVLASGSCPSDGSVRLWAVGETRAEPLRTLETDSGVSGLAYAPDGQQLAAGTATGDIFIWDAASGEERLRLDTGAGPVHNLFYTRDGTTLLGGTATLTAWDATTGEPLTAPTQGLDALERVVYHAGAEWFAAAATGSDAIRVWPASDDDAPRTLSGHSDRVAALAFDPTGTVLASASADQTVRLWDLSGGDAVVLDGHGGPVAALAFHPDGTLLASAGSDQTVIVWGAATETPEESALATLAANAAAANAEDLERYVATLHPDSPLFEATARTMQDLFATYDLAITIEQAEVVERNGNDIWVWVVQTTHRLAGPPFEDHRQTALYLLRPSGGVWKIYRTEIVDRAYFS